MALRLLDFDVPETPLTEPIQNWLELARQRIELYWDNFRQKPLPQYVECDFDLVARALCECMHRDLVDGRLFVEWGCGFGVVTGLAAMSGLDAIGIEAESFLCEEARLLLSRGNISAEIWEGNFLPRGARRLAEDADPLVSLTHDVQPAYDQYDMPIEDFAIVFAYPWPGEEHFLRLVFDRYARVDAILLMYRGPYHVEVYRKR